MSDFQVQFLSSSGQVLVTGDRIDESLYQLKVVAKSHTEEPNLAMSASLSLAASTRPLSLVLWHRRTGHRNCADIVKTAVKGALTGLHLGDFRRPPVCEGCIFGKLHRCKFSTSTHRATEVGDLIHSDVGSPIYVPTPEGFRYFVIVKDDCIRYTVVKLMTRKVIVSRDVTFDETITIGDNPVMVQKSSSPLDFYEPLQVVMEIFDQVSQLFALSIHYE